MKKKKTTKKKRRKNIRVSTKRGVKKNKSIGRVIITAIIALLIILLLLILSVIGVFEEQKQEEKISIRDECSLVMGNLIHQIRDSGDCRIRCINDCEVREKEFVRSEFASRENDCHVCDCFCK